jgi:hypothetical protein
MLLLFARDTSRAIRYECCCFAAHVERRWYGCCLERACTFQDLWSHEGMGHGVHFGLHDRISSRLRCHALWLDGSGIQDMSAARLPAHCVVRPSAGVW